MSAGKCVLEGEAVAGGQGFPGLLLAPEGGGGGERGGRPQLYVGGGLGWCLKAGNCDTSIRDERINKPDELDVLSACLSSVSSILP